MDDRGRLINAATKGKTEKGGLADMYAEEMHLMPFDGTIGWKKIIKELKQCNYHGPITIEPCYRYRYLEMNINDFYKKGYEIGEKLKEMFCV